MDSIDRPPRRSRMVAALVLILVFAAGVLAGAVGDRAYLFFHERIIPPGGLDFMAGHLVRRLDRELDLTDAQETEVARILERHAARMKGRMSAMHRELHGELEEAHEEIAVLLTPEQRLELERLRSRWEHR